MYFKFIDYFPVFFLLIFYFSSSSTLKIPEDFSEPAQIDTKASATKETSKALFYESSISFLLCFSVNMQRCLWFENHHIFCFYYMYIQKTVSVIVLSLLPCSHLLIFFATWVKLIFQENRRRSVKVSMGELEALLGTSKFSTEFYFD